MSESRALRPLLPVVLPLVTPPRPELRTPPRSELMHRGSPGAEGPSAASVDPVRLDLHTSAAPTAQEGA